MCRSNRGTGLCLGLWISKAILNSMGGDIAVKSHVGFGTNMIIAFPSQTCPQRRLLSGAFPHSLLANSLAGIPLFRSSPLVEKRCFVVDDGSEHAWVVREMLKSAGLRLSLRQSVDSALEFYKATHNLDLVVTDLRLSESHGQDLIAEIRRHEREADRSRIPIVMLAEGEEERRAGMQKREADEYLIKPVKLPDLVGSLERALNKKQGCDRGKRIMLVDDDAINRKILANLLKQSGNRVSEFGTVAEVRPRFAHDWEIGNDRVRGQLWEIRRDFT
ncbi:MAG: hybrid sensor histidine kinase/response regulator [Candidatus Pacebacteria bacterium]|nr:hybrid sensor histidine kinase/response regulator [Candidatus Paceibacterota bacterium]